MIATMENEKTAKTTTDIAARFLDVLGRRDFDELETLLARNVWFRALLPRRIHESANAQDAIAAFRDWIGQSSDFQVLATDHHNSQGREFVSYRFLLRPEWAPEQWHIMEQSGYLREKESSISRLDIVCTGFFPIDEVEPYLAVPRSDSHTQVTNPAGAGL